MEFCQGSGTLLVSEQLDIISVGNGRENSVNRPRREQVAGNELIQQPLRDLEQFPGLGVFQDRRASAPQIPGVKERGAVNEWRKVCKGNYGVQAAHDPATD